jgi:cytochrome o ubiquinol oxidase subunit 1
MIIGGVLFGFFAGLIYWFPKIFGFMLDERLGTWAFWSWITGFLLAFIPLYILGLMGETRRIDTPDPATGSEWLYLVSALGAVVIALGVALQIAQLIRSIKNRKKYHGGPNPWHSKGPEWDADETEEGHSGTGFLIGAASFVCGFGLIWQIWWLAALGFAAVIALLIYHSFEPASHHA